MRVHKDVYDLACHMAATDRDKLLSAQHLLFAPDCATWLDIDGGEGNIGFYFHGHDTDNVQRGEGLLIMQRHDDEPAFVPCHIDLEEGTLSAGYSPRMRKMTGMDGPALDIIAVNQTLSSVLPLLLAILALVNSPKVVSFLHADQKRLNRRREAKGKYLYHPHHTVRLNVDKKVQRAIRHATGDGPTRALHLVRAHLRFVRNQYVLVKPHWRGDPQKGIMNTTYEADRQNSKWSKA
jgi:hypothetical protein